MSMSKEIIIIGASGHGKVIADIAEKSGDKVIGFLDDDLTKKGVIGPVCDCVKYKDKQFIIGIGNTQIRKRIAEEYPELSYYTAIHPTAVISGDVKIAEGTAIMANAVINASATVGAHSIINTASVVEHDNMIGDFVHISPGAVLCGGITIGNETHIGAGVVVRNNVTICGNVTIGCGACVVKDITKRGMYIGTPAKVFCKQEMIE